jgi:hypothetical protein
MTAGNPQPRRLLQAIVLATSLLAAAATAAQRAAESAAAQERPAGGGLLSLLLPQEVGARRAVCVALGQQSWKCLPIPSKRHRSERRRTLRVRRER